MLEVFINGITAGSGECVVRKWAPGRTQSGPKSRALRGGVLMRANGFAKLVVQKVGAH